MKTVTGKCEGCGGHGKLTWNERARKFLCVLCYKFAEVL